MLRFSYLSLVIDDVIEATLDFLSRSIEFDLDLFPIEKESDNMLFIEVPQLRSPEYFSRFKSRLFLCGIKNIKLTVLMKLQD